MDKLVAGFLAREHSTANPPRASEKKFKIPRDKKNQFLSRTPDEFIKRKLFQPNKIKYPPKFSFRPFTSIREMRSLPPPSNRGKMGVMGIGPFLTQNLVLQMEMILQTEKDRIERMGKTRGRKGVTEEEAGGGVFGEEEDEASRHSDGSEGKKSIVSERKSVCSRPAEEVQQARENRKKEIRDEERQKLAQRHLATEEVVPTQLERKSGILKYRASLDAMASTASSQSSVGTYGFIHTSQYSPRSEAFAQPRSPYQPRDPLLHEEFRGLMQRDNPEAVRKMRTMFNSRASTLSGSQLSVEDYLRTKKSSLPATPRDSES